MKENGYEEMDLYCIALFAVALSLPKPGSKQSIYPDGQYDRPYRLGHC